MPRKKKIPKPVIDLIPEGYTIFKAKYVNWRPVIKGTIIKKKLILTERSKDYLTSSAGLALKARIEYMYTQQIKIARRLKKSKVDPRTLAYLMPFYYMHTFEIWVHKDTFTWEIVILKKHKLPDFEKSKD